MVELESKKFKSHISFSEYRLFLSCPHKHFLSKILGIEEGSSEALVFGKALHTSIEVIIKTKPSIALWESVFKKELRKEIEKSKLTFSEGAVGLFTKQGSSILRELDYFKRYQDWEVVGSEIDIFEPIFEDDNTQIFFKAFIDLVLRNKTTGRYLILDWKSANKPWDIESKYKVKLKNKVGEDSFYSFPEEIANTSEEKSFFGQVSLYKYFLAVRLKIPADLIDTAYVVLPRNDVNQLQQYDVLISQEYSNFLINDIIRVAKEIVNVDPTKLEKAKLRDKAEKGNACLWCSFKKQPEYCNDEVNQIVKK